jgi:hypothetical protein
VAKRIDPERLAVDAGGELAAQCGEALRSLAVYGSAAGGVFDPERSDVNLALVLEPLGFTELQRVAQWWARWRRQRLAAPLMLSATDLQRSCDVFPLELLDLRARHRLLAGSDVFTTLTIPPDAVRLQCEREAKGKLLRLRALYLELTGSTRDLDDLVRDSRKTFLAVVRGLVFVREQSWQVDGRAAVEAFERLYGERLPVIASAGRPADGALSARFADYLAEVEILAGHADREAQVST